VARGDRDGALTMYLDQLKRTPTLDLAARIGDLYTGGGDGATAERYYQLAEDLAGPAVVQTEPALALFLLEHDRKLDDATKIAKAVASMRHDIFTEMRWRGRITKRAGWRKYPRPRRVHCGPARETIEFFRTQLEFARQRSNARRRTMRCRQRTCHTSVRSCVQSAKSRSSASARMTTAEINAISAKLNMPV
jgi:hypothetical protein